ncbi:MAG: exo-alpha-sialidase [Chloroflexi bacterium]|nr:exo-alpha-sialidase [Chloroflexota bacterium]
MHSAYPTYYNAITSLVGARTSEVQPSGSCSYLIRSRDGGKTWGEPSLIGVNCTETALLALPDGDVIAVMRDDSPQALHITRSADGGATWTQPAQLTGPRQHPADLLRLSNGDILMTYGNRQPPYRVEGRVSHDGGRSWNNTLLTFSGNLYGYNVTAPRPTDLGYPSSVVQNGQGVTMYYYNPSINQPLRVNQRENEARYLARDYYAIAVTWDEQELIDAIGRIG